MASLSLHAESKYTLNSKKFENILEYHKLQYPVL